MMEKFEPSDAMKQHPLYAQLIRLHDEHTEQAPDPECAWCVGIHSAITHIETKLGKALGDILVMLNTTGRPPPDQVDDGASAAREWAQQQQSNRQYGEDHRN